MKKNVIFLILLTSSFAFGQVGFNTPNPQATVDIVAKNATGKSTNVDGLLVPRVDRERAQVMVGAPVSTLVYINSIATGSQTGIAANIDAVGYYYHNGTAWIKLESANQNLNIYTSDGTLSENRTVKQEDKTLAFTANSVNAFSIDEKTFSVDASSNKVGVGTIEPNSDLQVVGSEFRLGGPSSQAGTVANPLLRIHSNANTDASGGEIRFSEDDLGYGYYLRHNTEAGNTYGLDGLAIGAASSGSYSYNPAKPGMFVASSQNIGFGTATPQTIFHVDAARDNNINTAPSATQQSNDFVISPAGTVGIGNLSPRGALDINKGETNNHGLVLPTNASVNNFTNPLGGSIIPGTIIYDSTNDCVKFYKKSGNWSNCVDGGTTSPETGTVVSLDCANASTSGTLKSGTAASGVSSTISYTGGNGGNYSGHSVNSTGVTNLTATLSSGSFNNGNGTLTYTITGTPNSAGVASFSINIGGKNCTLTINVEARLQPSKQIRFGYYGTYSIGHPDMASIPFTSQLRSSANYGSTGHYKGVTDFAFSEVTVNELSNSTGAQLKAKYDIINVGRFYLDNAKLDHIKDFANLGGVVIMGIPSSIGGTLIDLVLASFNVTGPHHGLSTSGLYYRSSPTLEFSNVWGDTKGIANIGAQDIRVLSEQLPAGSTVYATESEIQTNSTIWTPPGYNGRIIIIHSESPFWQPTEIKDASINTNLEKYLHNLIVYAIEKARGA